MFPYSSVPVPYVPYRNSNAHSRHPRRADRYAMSVWPGQDAHAKKCRRLSGSLRAFESVTASGEPGHNKVAAMRHIVGVGKIAEILQDTLAEVILDVQSGAVTKGDLVARLEQVQSGANFAMKVVQASAGKLTNKGKDTNGIGGSYVASMVNSRNAAKQRRDAVRNGSAAGGKRGRSALGELTNLLSQPGHFGLKEVPGSGLRPKRKLARGAPKVVKRRNGHGTPAQAKRRNVSRAPSPLPPRPHHGHFPFNAVLKPCFVRAPSACFHHVPAGADLAAEAVAGAGERD